MAFLAFSRAAAWSLAALLAGCAEQAASAASDRAFPRVLAREFPVRVDQANGELRLASPPRRVLPGNAAWVDHLTLLVGPERVVALPAEAFGYSRLAASADGWGALPRLTVFEGERIVALAPDLVLAHAWQNPETLAALARAGIPALVVPVPASWHEVLATLDLLGVVLGVPERAGTVHAELEARRTRLAERARPFAHLRALSYTNLGAGGWTSGRSTTGDTLLALAGLRNAAGEAGLTGDVPADRERLLALAPDVFLVGRPDTSESSPPSATFLLGEPALAGLTAIRRQRIVTLPPALFDSASPELLVAAERLVDELERLARAAPFDGAHDQR